MPISLESAMDIVVKNKNIHGHFIAPPSKSHAQRILAAVLMLGEEFVVSNVGNSDDVLAAIQIVNALGSQTKADGKRLTIMPRKEIPAEHVPVLDCGESALCARLFPPVAAVLYDSFVVKAGGSLLNRNIVDDYAALKYFGLKFKTTDGNFPVDFFESKIHSGNIALNAIKTSQLASGLLMALSFAEKDFEINIENLVSRDYLLLTIDVLKKFGRDIEIEFVNPKACKISCRQKPFAISPNIQIEGDWSGISNILVAAAINGNVEISGLSENSVQADKAILQVFDKAGVDYYWKNEILFVKKSSINAFDFDAKDCPDLIPALVILAIFANGKSRIAGMNRLLYKESSRAIVMRDELSKAGIFLEIKDDKMLISGNQTPESAVLNSHGDHRMAMAFTVFGLNTLGGVIIQDSECVSKSWPGFFEVIG
jgi:3-phosphoshikimate 1-carboxyvinyltransferase